MTQCRDWLSTLWSASFRGFAFYFESDDEEGGRGLVVHKFPNRDSPYVEDLGEEPRLFEGNAYVHGDDADALAAAFSETLSARGPATLVVPIRGPVPVHCQTWKRHHERDRLGYVAFNVRFVREGTATALVSLPVAAHRAYLSAEGAADALARWFPSALTRAGTADYVITAAIDGVARAAALLDAVRSSNPVEAAASASLRDRLTAIVADAPVLLDRGAPLSDAADLAAGLVSAARDLAAAMAPETAARALAEAIEVAGVPTLSPPYASRSVAAAARNTAAAARLARLSLMIACAEAALARAYRARPDGVAARADIVALIEREIADLSGAADAALYVALCDLRGHVVDYLSHLINDLAPVITIEAARQMPSLFWAWRLYADPARCGELVARNAVRAPAFMPATFSALAF